MIKNASYPSTAGFCLLALVMLAVSGCGGGPDTEEQPVATLPAAVASPAPTYVRLSSATPPAPQPEDVPEIADQRRETWRPGYWSYEGGEFKWAPGEIIPKPSFTAVWMSDHWEKRQYGWAFVPGYWQ